MDAPEDRVHSLEGAGVEVVGVARTVNGILDPAAVLDELSARGIQSVLIEGGAQVAESFLTSGLVERFHEFGSPAEFGSGALAGPRNTPSNHPEGWRLVCDTAVGDDRYRMWERVEAFQRMES
jgi:diaminohydroxyphosphoribosylaminopyrimidine deaminase/5-amino-6-(5-phosphoribosylamino)uracil reductase